MRGSAPNTVSDSGAPRPGGPRLFLSVRRDSCENRPPWRLGRRIFRLRTQRCSSRLPVCAFSATALPDRHLAETHKKTALLLRSLGGFSCADGRETFLAGAMPASEACCLRQVSSRRKAADAASVPEILANQLHMDATFQHVPFNNAPHIADSLRRSAIET